ncbi:hypothetical protein Y032_0349g3203 [Ancylostoma ceylanicum]|uniref:Uncharacterized protein n=1 Tax=Ancylostoma ceylanicum TaxID=53326 RepID=A0A016RWX7_9BILA|nr:hypothetical protein Y032_0349g3203 [Ancylostoma ceylanicum]
MEIKMLHWMAFTTLFDRIWNQDSRQRFTVASITDGLHEARLQWYGHVLHANNDNVCKISFNLDVTGESPKVRLKQQRMDYLHNDLRRIGAPPNLHMTWQNGVKGSVERTLS